MRFIRYAWARLRSLMARRAIERAHKTGKASSFLMALAGVSGVGPAAWEKARNESHPREAQALDAWSALRDQNRIPVLALGDSLLDIPRDELGSIPGEWNLSLSGQTSGGFSSLIWKMRQQNPFWDRVGAVVLPSFGNDGWFWPSADYLSTSIDRAVAAARRALGSGPRLILLEFPPTYSPALQHLRIPQALHLREIMQRDGNASVVSFSQFGWSPSVTLSSDGAHLTPEGVRRLDEAIQSALIVEVGSVIDA